MEKIMESVAYATSGSFERVVASAYLRELVATAPISARIWGELRPCTGTPLAAAQPETTETAGMRLQARHAAGVAAAAKAAVAADADIDGIGADRERSVLKTSSVNTNSTDGTTGKTFVVVQNDSGSRTLRPPV